MSSAPQIFIRKDDIKSNTVRLDGMLISDHANTVLREMIIDKKRIDRGFLIKKGLSEKEIETIASSITIESQDQLEYHWKSIEISIENINNKHGFFVVFKYQSEDDSLSEQLFPIKNEKAIIKYKEENIKNGSIVFLSIKGPSGEIQSLKLSGGGEADEIFLHKEKLQDMHMELFDNYVPLISEIPSRKAKKIKGRLLSKASSNKLEDIQIVIEASVSENADKKELFPVCYAITEQGGYFETNLPAIEDIKNIKYAHALIGLGDVQPIPIRLNKNIIDPMKDEADNNQYYDFPEKVILFIDAGDVYKTQNNCDCEDLNFHKKKSLEEFSFYTVVRTTEPLIEAYEVSDIEEIELSDIIPDNDAEIKKLLAGRRISTVKLQNFISRNGFINSANIQKILPIIRNYEQSKAIKSVTKAKEKNVSQGRINLENGGIVDWDEKPTIYQATSIAHGHLLHFKQEWFNDGYTIGDLLYSLPLAPGQKKQIVTFDWDRKDSASNTQQLDYQDSLYNSLSRDRDVNEIATSHLTEEVNGNSSSDTWGWGVGGGVGAAIPAGPVPIPVGALVGAGGGGAGGSSEAYQKSTRDTTASSQQHINDKTVQAANSVRSQRSTVIQTVSQGERFQVSAEVVANYNHCHAMTMQYFEVLRHFEVSTRLVDVQECLFIPLKMSPFDRKKALRWREILSLYLKKRELVAGFDALERYNDAIEKCGEGNKECIDEHYDFLKIPEKYSEEVLQYIEGELYIEFQINMPEIPEDLDISKIVSLPGWMLFGDTVGRGILQELLETKIRYEIKKAEAFAQAVGEKIADLIVNNLKFFAKQNKIGATEKFLPIDATLLSNFKANSVLYVSLRMKGSFDAYIKREDIDFISIKIDDSAIAARLSKLKELINSNFVRIIIHNGSMRYRTENLHEYLFKNSYIKNDLMPNDHVSIFTPLSSKALKRPRFEDVELSNGLLNHLNESIEYYHQCIWLKMDSQRRFMLLDGLVAPGKGKGRSVASVVENKLIGIVGNCIVMPVAPGFQLDPTLDDNINLFEHYYASPQDPMHISLPTKGVFAEAVMGKCNSCEKKDESRFWRWEESPIPDSPTSINPVSLPTAQNVQPANLQPKDFPASIINLQNAPNLPDPQGFGKLSELIGKSDLFKDITGLTENQKNALGALQAAFGTAQFFGGKAAELVPLAAKTQVLEQVRKAKENGLITDEQAQDLTQETFNSMLSQSEGVALKTADDIAKVERKVKDKSLSEKEGGEAKRLIKEEGQIELEKKKADLERSKVFAESIKKTSDTPNVEVAYESGSDKLKISNGVIFASNSHDICCSYQYALTDSVGLNAKNHPHDVITLKERFVELGFDWITLNSSMDSETIDVIKLFQSIIRGRQSINGDGRVDVSGATYYWLNSDNAPRWLSLDDGSKTDKAIGYYNSTKNDDGDDHYFGTNWLVDTIKLAGEEYYYNYLINNDSASVIFINEMAKPKGGQYKPHATHQTGLNVDIKLPKTDGSSGGINYNSALYDRNACRSMILSFGYCSLVKAVRFNDPDLIKEGICTFLTGHDNHLHIELTPPEIGNALYYLDSKPKNNIGVSV